MSTFEDIVQLFLTQHHLKDVISLTELIVLQYTCKSIFWIISEIITSRVTYSWDPTKVFTFLKPKKITVQHNSINENKLPLLAGLYCNLPSSVSKITFSDSYPLPVTELPATYNITHITFGKYFNSSVDNLPHSLTHLVFGASFNKPTDKLPPKLSHLTYGVSFNLPCDNLPLSLTHLVFGFCFNTPTEKLPLGLTHLTYANRFNQGISPLPPSLTHLKFGVDFNRYFRVELPCLKHLTFGLLFDHYSAPLDLRHLESLTHLILGQNFNSVITLPQNLLHIEFSKKFDRPVEIPPKVTHLSFGSYFNQPVTIPPSVLHLAVGYQFKQQIKFPPFLVSLKLDGKVCDIERCKLLGTIKAVFL